MTRSRTTGWRTPWWFVVAIIGVAAVAVVVSIQTADPRPEPPELKRAEWSSAQAAYQEVIYNSPNRASTAALRVSDGQFGVDFDPPDMGDCQEFCAIFQKAQNGYEVTLPVGWSNTGYAGEGDELPIVKLTYWDPFMNNPITVTAESGSVSVPDALYSLPLSELEIGQVMYMSSAYIRLGVVDGEVVGALVPKADIEVDYLPDETFNKVSVMRTDSGLVACLDGNKPWFDQDVATTGQTVKIVGC